MMVRKQIRVDKINRTIRTKVSTEMGLEDLGMVSDTRVRYTVMASKHVMAYPILSPESADSRNTIQFRNTSSTTGMKRLMMKKEDRRSWYNLK